MLGWTSVSRFCHVIGNFLEFPITQKGTNVPMMRTRAKQKYVTIYLAIHVHLKV